MQTDFNNLNDGDKITLYPNSDNPLHQWPVTATYYSGFFYCHGTDPFDGPDYYLGDVLRYNDGYTKD